VGVQLRRAFAYRQSGDSAGAEALWWWIFTLKLPDQFSNLDVGIYDHSTRPKPAASAAERVDRLDQVVTAAQWRAVLLPES
jgi:hypothetical protein